MIFSSHADLNDFERGGTLGRKKRRQVTAEQVGREENLEFHVGILMGIVTIVANNQNMNIYIVLVVFNNFPS